MQNDYSREEFFAYMDAWKPVLESSHKVFTQLQGGSMSGIVLIIATIGFNFDNISAIGAFEKWLIGGALVCLILSLGNILNCVRITDFLEGLLAGIRSRIIFDRLSDVPYTEVENLRNDIARRLVLTQQFYGYAYWCFLVAVTLGIICFISILLRF
ncbi:MAG: hypothetical protein HY272_06575 [Gammaproteobacteria bacterium]|nr:hypothetical protein [Gammaproteobacteria bacterium]